MRNKNRSNINSQRLFPGRRYPGVHPIGAEGGQLSDNPYATFKIYKRNIIQKQLEKYMDELRIKSTDIKDNDPSSIKELIFLASVGDFVNYEIDFDLFASILGIIWIIDEKKFDFHNQTEIEKLCYQGSELCWYLRNEPERHINWLTEILNYYKKNKTKLKNIET